MFNNYNKNDEINTEVSGFIGENFADDSIDEFKNHVMQAEIKNALQSSAGRVLKLNLKVYAFVDDMLVYFPNSDIQYETFTTSSFFINFHHLIKMKIHLHHSQITGKILGYAHDFCNTKVTKKALPIFQLLQIICLVLICIISKKAYCFRLVFKRIKHWMG